MKKGKRTPKKSTLTDLNPVLSKLLKEKKYLTKKIRINDLLKINLEEEFLFQFNFTEYGFAAVIETDTGDNKGFRTTLNSPFTFLATAATINDSPFTIRATNNTTVLDALLDCFQFSFLQQGCSSPIFSQSFPLNILCKFPSSSTCDCSLQIVDSILDTNICPSCNLNESTLSTPFFTATEFDVPTCNFNFESQIGTIEVTGSGTTVSQLPATFVLNVSKNPNPQQPEFNGYKLIVTDNQGGTIQSEQTLPFDQIMITNCL